MTPKASEVVAFGSREWFRRVGETSLALDAPHFHQALIGLFGCLIEHSARWIIRFSDPASPEIMYTHSVDQPLRDHYRDACSALDPFAAHWRLYREVGVRALSRFDGMVDAIDARSYSAAFMPAAKISDELALFLPTIGNSSIGLFLEREVGDFSDEEIACAKAAFPILNGLEKAHIGRVFDCVRQSGSPLKPVHLDPRPTLVQDRYGVEIFSSPSWQAALEQAPVIRTAAEQMDHAGPIMLDCYILSIEHLDKYFPLAPGGRMLTLARCSDDAEERSAARDRTELLRCLTPRERDIFDLILKGRSTSDISQLLSLSKGTIKNCILRIYKKSGMDSKRTFIQRYAFRATPSALTHTEDSPIR